jgi:uncharacterized membrane protein YcgQ (UPF0703/DUF1980 family)
MVSIYQIGEYTKKTPKEINPMGFVVIDTMTNHNNLFIKQTILHLPNL